MDNSNPSKTKQELNNTSNQLNPNNEKYWKSRGYESRPENWEEKILIEQTNLLKSDPFAQAQKRATE